MNFDGPHVGNQFIIILWLNFLWTAHFVKQIEFKISNVDQT